MFSISIPKPSLEVMELGPELRKKLGGLRTQEGLEPVGERREIRKIRIDGTEHKGGREKSEVPKKLLCMNVLSFFLSSSNPTHHV